MLAKPSFVFYSEFFLFRLPNCFHGFFFHTGELHFKIFLVTVLRMHPNGAGKLSRKRSTILFSHVSRYWQTRTHCCRHLCFPVCPRAQLFPGHKKCFSFCSETFCVRKKMFPSLRAQGNIMINNVSATMCPRLPPPLNVVKHFPLLF